MTAIQAMHKYLRHIRHVRHFTNSTVTSYGRIIKGFVLFLQQEGLPSRVEDIGTVHVRSYLASICGEITASTLQTKVCAIKSFFKFLVTEEVISGNPAAAIRTPKAERGIPTVASLDDITSMIESSGPHPSDIRDTAVLEVLYGAGLRSIEASGLNLTSIDLQNGTVRTIGKGNKERVVPLGRKAVQALEAYLKIRDQVARKGAVIDDTALFLNYLGTRLGKDSIYRIVRKRAASAGVWKHISPHSLRHSFATHMMENGADIRYVQLMLGHENLSTAQIYAHVNQAYLVQNYDTAHPLAHLPGPTAADGGFVPLKPISIERKFRRLDALFMRRIIQLQQCRGGLRKRMYQIHCNDDPDLLIPKDSDILSQLQHETESIEEKVLLAQLSAIPVLDEEEESVILAHGAPPKALLTGRQKTEERRKGS